MQVAHILFGAPRRRRGYLLFGTVVFAMASPVNALATYSRPCSDAAVWDPDVCERVEVIANNTTDVRQMIGWSVWVLLCILAAPILIRVFRGAS